MYFHMHLLHLFLKAGFIMCYKNPDIYYVIFLTHGSLHHESRWTTLEGNSCTSVMTYTRGSGYSF